MTRRISAEDFAAADGVADWVVEDDVARATFRTGDFGTGVRLVVEIGALADAANHHPDVDLRYPSVSVALTTHDAGGLTAKDVALAQAVSQAARALGIAARRP